VEEEKGGRAPKQERKSRSCTLSTVSDLRTRWRGEVTCEKKRRAASVEKRDMYRGVQLWGEEKKGGGWGKVGGKLVIALKKSPVKSISLRLALLGRKSGEGNREE